MSSTSELKDGSLSNILKEVLRLHHEFSTSSFFEHLQKLLLSVLGRDQFTFLGTDAGEGQALYSTCVENIRDRLNPPRVSLDEIRVLLDHQPQAGSQRQEPLGTLTIEGEELPVLEIWRLGAGGRHLSYLVFHSLPAEDISESQSQVIEEIHRNISIAFFKLCDQEQLRRNMDHYQAKLEAINDLGELLGSLDLEVLLTKLMELSLYVVSGQVGSIVLKEKDEVQCRVEWGLPLEMASCFRNREGRIIYEQVLTEGKAVSIYEFGEDAEYHIEGLEVEVGCYVCIPLTSKNRTLGVVNLVHAGMQGAGNSELDREILMTICGLAATSIENALLYQDSLEKERYKQSLAIARSIQKGLYPAQPPDLPWLDIAFRSESCDETGGDYFDFIIDQEDELTLVVGDVSGHGIGAALHMASARAGLRATIAQGATLAAMFQGLNTQMEADTDIDQFMTLFATTLNRGKKRISYVNGGHDAPILYRKESGTFEELVSTGMPLGLFSPKHYDTGEVAGLDSGDVLIVMTDGVWEVKGRGLQGQMLGRARLKEIFLSHVEGTAEEIAEGILADVNDYTGGRPARDDVTLVVIRGR